VKAKAAELLAEKEHALRTVREREHQIAEDRRNLNRVRDLVLLGAELDRYQEVLSQCQEKQEQAEHLGDQIGRIPATIAAVATIERLEVELAAATAALNAVATTVALSIEKAAVERVTLDGKSIDSTDVVHSVVEDLLIGIEGIGNVAIRPQVKDREVIIRRVDRAQQDLQEALDAVGANSPTAARAAAARRRELEHQLEGLRKEIARLAPGDINGKLPPGLGPLKIEIEELYGRRDAKMKALALDTLPERAVLECEIRNNTAEAERLAAEIETADADITVLGQAVEEAREEFEVSGASSQPTNGTSRPRWRHSPLDAAKWATKCWKRQPFDWRLPPQIFKPLLCDSNRIEGRPSRTLTLKSRGLRTPRAYTKRNLRSSVRRSRRLQVF
jgi:hypothetical protein